jgi:hypothetical protein
LEITALEIDRDRLRVELESRPRPEENGEANVSDEVETEASADCTQALRPVSTSRPVGEENEPEILELEPVEVDADRIGPYTSEPIAVSEPLPARNGEWYPRLQYTPGESPSLAFPSDADLALVRGQIQLLNQLLQPKQAAGQVLIYQRRLSEFTQKMREASRLATHLASEVELSRERDRMQYHLYLLRRAEEIDKP